MKTIKDYTPEKNHGISMHADASIVKIKSHATTINHAWYGIYILQEKKEQKI